MYVGVLSSRSIGRLSFEAYDTLHLIVNWQNGFVGFISIRAPVSLYFSSVKNYSFHIALSFTTGLAVCKIPNVAWILLQHGTADAGYYFKKLPSTFLLYSNLYEKKTPWA